MIRRCWGKMRFCAQAVFQEDVLVHVTPAAATVIPGGAVGTVHVRFPGDPVPLEINGKTGAGGDCGGFADSGPTRRGEHSA